MTVTDSAGIQITESAEPLWRGREQWVAGPEPLLRLGGSDDDARLQFWEITGALRLPDGRVAVADAGSQEIRFFGPDGQFLRSVGGQGGGPGEFSGLSAIGHAPGGGIWAYDFVLRRITWLDGDGNTAGLVTIGPEPPLLNPVGALADGSLILKQLWGVASPPQNGRVAGFRRDDIAYVRVARDGSLDSLGLFPGREVFGACWGCPSTTPFSRNSVAAVRGDRVLIGDQEDFEIGEYRADGTLARLIRFRGDDLALTDDVLSRVLADRVENAPEAARASLRAHFDTMPRPGTIPAYGPLIVDASGNLWVGDWEGLPPVWTVIAPDGRLLGRVVLPNAMQLWDVADDCVVGVQHDSLDVEHVVVYPLRKAADRRP